MNLFIIGNGFDLAHGLKTSYWNFREYLQGVNWRYLQSLEEMYGFYIWDGSDELYTMGCDALKDYLWKDFETNLAHIDEIAIIDQGERVELGLESGDIGIEDTLYDHWNEQYKFIKRLNDFVMSWISQVNIDVERITSNINADDLFITFNYTLLLEQVYNIDKYNILHIHGSIDEDDISPVIGHGNKEKIIEISEIYTKSSEKFYEKKAAIYGALANFYKNTLKDVDYFLSINEEFFKRLKDVKSVSIIGHSLGDVDMPYFKKIYSNINHDTIWNIYIYDDNDDNREKYKEKIIGIGVNEEKIKIFNSNLFFN